MDSYTKRKLYYKDQHMEKIIYALKYEAACHRMSLAKSLGSTYDRMGTKEDAIAEADAMEELFTFLERMKEVMNEDL